jgi:hypothetical protein
VMASGRSAAGLIGVVPVVVVVRMIICGGAALTGGLAGIQQPGWPWLPQQPCRIRSLTKVLEAAIRNLAANGASQVAQLENKAPGLGCGRVPQALT